MKKFSKPLLVIATSMSLLACGGGGGGGDATAPATAPVAADPADKYAGTWSVCVDNRRTTTITVPGTTAVTPTTTVSGTTTTTSSSTATDSSRLTLQMTKNAAAVLQFQNTGTAYKGVGCTGTGTNVAAATTTGTFTIVGSKPVGGLTADKIQGTSNRGSGKDLMHVSTDGLKLMTGDLSKGTDAEGFPNALETDLVLTKHDGRQTVPQPFPF